MVFEASWAKNHFSGSLGFALKGKWRCICARGLEPPGSVLKQTIGAKAYNMDGLIEISSHAFRTPYMAS